MTQVFSDLDAFEDDVESGSETVDLASWVREARSLRIEAAAALERELAICAKAIFSTGMPTGRLLQIANALCDSATQRGFSGLAREAGTLILLLERLGADLGQAQLAAGVERARAVLAREAALPEYQSPSERGALLLIGGDAKVREQAERAAGHRSLRVVKADSVQAARSMIATENCVGAVVVEQSELPAEIVKALRSVVSERFPIVVSTSPESLADRIEIVRAGASMIVGYPLDPTEVEVALASFEPSEGLASGRVLIIDDDEDFNRMVCALLRARGIEAWSTSNPGKAWEMLEDNRPDLVMVDVRMPEVSGFELCKVLRASPDWRDVPVLFVTGSADAETRQSCFEAGGDDYLGKPVIERELLARVQFRLERSRSLKDDANRDPLTGLLTRRALQRVARHHLDLTRRGRGTVLSVAILDLDHFKSVNDAHGHDVGDLVLKSLAAVLMRQLRSEDAKARWGGEEIVVLLPDAEQDRARAVIERVLTEFRAQVFEGKFPFRVTFSAGIATTPLDGVTLEGLLLAADRRLYRAKAQGRNAIEASGGPRLSIAPPA